VKRRRILEVGLAFISAIAAGFYLQFGPRSPTVAGGQGQALKLREPRSLLAFDFSDGDGRPAHLSSFRGKVILLNVWATWCGPCRKEMPALDRLQANLGGADFEVIAVSIDRDALPAVKAFYRQTGLGQLRTYSGEAGQIMSSLGIIGIPTTLLIDRQGKEIGRAIGPEEWDSPVLTQIIRDHLDAPVQSASQ